MILLPNFMPTKPKGILSLCKEKNLWKNKIIWKIWSTALPKKMPKPACACLWPAALAPGKMKFMWKRLIISGDKLQKWSSSSTLGSPAAESWGLWPKVFWTAGNIFKAKPRLSRESPPKNIITSTKVMKSSRKLRM